MQTSAHHRSALAATSRSRQVVAESRRQTRPGSGRRSQSLACWLDRYPKHELREIALFRRTPPGEG